MTNKFNRLDLAFGALSDPTRRAVVMRLSLKPASVSELAEPFAMAMPTILQHIRVLEASGLVETAKIGRVRMCKLRVEAVQETEQWLAMQRVIWEGRLDRMETYVNNLQAMETTNDSHRRIKK
ncbi:metalloregulator ArsR/SmtB family transcription factor [Acidiphilium sp. AL]|uniref:ArsR/SmtB family transcription factor n=1 Tax=Acidiphilium sp. AL TaxID=2871704 RepID=UPI0021CB8A41|nr:metalloregulator ArsR/SmtB family transcription factor [Acidiphilium sp. AL]MCU4162230.1 metalloregulator ArsR/SmtB family transcription factor [Acidiphilium sp. AL]